MSYIILVDPYKLLKCLEKRMYWARIDGKEWEAQYYLREMIKVMMYLRGQSYDDDRRRATVFAQQRSRRRGGGY